MWRHTYFVNTSTLFFRQNLVATTLRCLPCCTVRKSIMAAPIHQCNRLFDVIQRAPGMNSCLGSNSKHPRKRDLVKLDLTFEVRKASKLLVKSMTNENMTSSTWRLLSWLLPKPGSIAIRQLIFSSLKIHSNSKNRT